MGATADRVVKAARPRWRAYLLLARVSNLPTVWSNTLAGMALVVTLVPWDWYVWVALSVSLFYVGGMFLNDAFDAEIDRRDRPERPIPANDVTRREAFIVAAVALSLGVVMLPPGTPQLLGLGLAATIVLYDIRHKGERFAPLIMGLCRGLVYFVAAAAVSTVTTVVIAAALVLISYVTALTVVAKLAGANARWLVPLLIAGISIVDAMVILSVTGSLMFSGLAALGFPLTLLFQRVVPGD
jgi:4-hydroxybenzoate polyprenyltransferase